MAFVTVNAQIGTPPKTPDNDASARSKSSKETEAARILNERRASAQSLPLSLAADARTFKDQALRARTQARIADASDKEASDLAEEAKKAVYAIDHVKRTAAVCMSPPAEAQ